MSLIPYGKQSMSYSGEVVRQNESLLSMGQRMMDLSPSLAHVMRASSVGPDDSCCKRGSSGRLWFWLVSDLWNEQGFRHALDAL